jgi:nucleotide-binding universal stress UspA family protein
MTSQIRPAVVVGVDGSEHSLVALDLAADEATRRHEPLRIVTGFLWPLFAPAAPVPGAAVTDDAIGAADRMLTDAAERIGRTHLGLDVTTEVVMGGPAAVLVGESQRASLVVVGNRGHGGFTSLLAGSVATQLATHARCPVIVVRPGSAVDAATTHPVVVGVDGHERTEPAIEFAFEEAASRGVSLTAVNVWAEPPRSGSDLFKPIAYDYDEARKTAARELAESLAGFQEKYPDVPVFRELICGLDAAQHLQRATAEAGLVVVGSRGRGELGGLLLGSVGQTLVHHAHCPVAIVRPNERDVS